MKFNRVSWRRSVGTAIAIGGVVTLLAGCGAKSTTPSDSSSGSATGSVTAQGISPERCEANKKAGQITYLTGFDYAASATIADVVLADRLGYFKKMCLDVKLQSGFTTANVPLVSENKAQLTGLGSLSEVADANAKGANLVAIAAYGHSPIEALAVSGKAHLGSVADVKGTTMGVVGSIPFSIRTMLVRNSVPLDSFEQLQISYDPTQLDSGKFASRPVYKSSEPRQLDKANISYKLFDPITNGNVPGSFGVMVVNRDFLAANRSAVEDFLRADLMGFSYGREHGDEAVRATTEKSDPKYYLTTEGESFRWQTELDLIASSTPPDRYVGFLDKDSALEELRLLVDPLKVIATERNLEATFDDGPLRSIHDGTRVIWPN